MKVFLLAVTIMMLIGRIKATPKNLSKTLYKNSLQKSVDNLKKTVDNIKVESNKEAVLSITQSIINVFIWLWSLLIIVYYILIGNRFSSNATMLMLSAIQIITVLVSTKAVFKNFNLLNIPSIENIKFDRYWLLFNVILDYVYYPMTIYLLMT